MITAIVYTFAVLVVSILPAQALSSFDSFSFQHLDKLVHVLMYTLLAFLWFKTLNKGNYTRPQSAVMAIVISLYGVLMEYAQTLIKGRSLEWEDMLSNTVGAILGIIIASLKRTSAA